MCLKIREHDKEKLMIREERDADHAEPLMLRNLNFILQILDYPEEFQTDKCPHQIVYFSQCVCMSVCVCVCLFGK